MNKYLLVLFCSSLIFLMLVFSLLQREDDPLTKTQHQEALVNRTKLKEPIEAPLTTKPDDPKKAIEITEPLEFSSSAYQSFNQSIHQPDSRQPPINRTTDDFVANPMWDHDAYQQLENSRHQQLIQQYKIAAKKKLQQIDTAIEEGKKKGISKSLLQEAIEKREAINSMLMQLDKKSR
ncbi:hypothetical protein [Pleionea litopenaei]|uniref:Uncharacterized protein n=1 Tax=Pleionea litopenaei TaxID=3070815 RepID=A0AA51RRP6_9GAMM|nr:hypothetical protein [Pleionea sp. HL-JVS1]WMS86239.1 hypothetical protein Q9312_13525 [Pleionea sp. HL-JVS1]